MLANERNAGNEALKQLRGALAFLDERVKSAGRPRRPLLATRSRRNISQRDTVSTGRIQNNSANAKRAALHKDRGLSSDRRPPEWNHWNRLLPFLF